MAVSEPRIRTDPTRASSGAPAALARLYWMMGGNAALGFLLAFIAKSRPAFSSFDLAYWAVFASLIAVRYVDVTRLGGSTAEGTPATRAHWRRYSAVLSAICVAAWAAAHAVALLIGG